MPSNRALTGNQIVLIVAACCAALVLAPVGVYAAATQKVSIVDAKKPKHAVRVDGKGRISSVVSGTVGAVPLPPTQPFHRGQKVSDQTPTLGAPIPKGKRLAITSLSTTWFSGMSSANGEGLRVIVRKANAGGTCPSAGPVLGVVAEFVPPHNDSGPQPVSRAVDRTFPSPQVWRANGRALCLQVDAGVAGFPIVVDGYLF